MKYLIAIFLCLLASATVQAGQQLVYVNDFEGAVGAEWSSSSTDVTPIGGRHFLGQFHSGTVTLHLGDLPVHSGVQVSFDLFAIRTWDGNLTEDPGSPGKYIGPDVWGLYVEGGPNLIQTTFNNHDFYPGWTQAYPGTYPGGSYAPRTGAAENNTLGFTWDGYGIIDSVYRMSFAFDHSSPDITLGFWASTVDWIYPQYDPNTESWGLDNFQLSITPVPEPSSILALLGGIGGLGAMTRLRIRR